MGVLGATNADLLAKTKALESRVLVLEGWKTAVNSSLTTLASKIAALEAAGTVDLSAIESRLTTLENKTCPEQDRFAAIEADVAELQADHVPEP